MIAKYTFNMGENKFAAQFTESRERVTGYIQRSGMDGCYLVAKTIRTRTGQTIALPAAVDVNALDKADLEVICVEVVKSVAKRRQKLEESLKKGYAIVYDQCSQESTNINVPYRGDPNDTGVAFLQCGGQDGRGGQEGGAGRGAKNEGGSSGEGTGAGDDVSAMTGRTGGKTAKTNSRGESHCFNFGSPSHWAYECPQLSGKQQSQLHMNLEAHEESTQEPAEEAQQLFNVTLAQGGELPNNRVYLDG